MTLREPSDLQRPEDDLTTVQGRFRAIFDASPIGMALAGTDGRFLQVNRAYCEIVGYSESELLQMGFIDITHPDDMADSAEVVSGVTEHPAVSGSMEKRYVCKDGKIIWVSGVASAVRGSDGAVQYVLGQVRDITDERASLAALREAEELFRDAFEYAPTGMMIVNLDGTYRRVNAAICAILGYSPEELVGHTVFEFTHPDSLAQDREAIQMLSSGEVEVVEENKQYIHKDGHVVYARIHAAAVHHPDGSPAYWLTQVDDITADMRADAVREQALRALREGEARFRGGFEQSPIGMCLAGVDGRIIQTNAAFCAILGYSVTQLRERVIQDLTHPEDCDSAWVLHRALLAGTLDRYQRELRFVRKNGQTIWVSLYATLLADAAGQAQRVLTQIIDTTARHRLEDELRQLADHDQLTGLLNRRGFEAALARHCAYVQRYGARGAVLLLDLDQFKAVNDTLGHWAGDRVLASVASVLQHRLRATDTVSRLGGDEFAILLAEAGSADAKRVASSIVHDIGRNSTVIAAGLGHRVTASVGIALVDETVTTADAALVNADLAMYDAKQAGRDQVALYGDMPRGHTPMRSRLVWFERIRSALVGGRFVLYAQPIVELASGRVAQYELLLRMLDGDGGIVPPSEFIHIAENYDLIQGIDRWVVGQAIELIAQHGRQGDELTLEVNVSGRSLADEHLIDVIEAAMRRSGISPARLIFEITETAAIENMALAQAFAQRLATIGCHFALDDFGSGFGGFYYLKHIPFDFVKIDREFVIGCLTDRTDTLVIDAIVAIARGLQRRTIAEGVEDGAALRFLHERGVDFAQGYHLARPAPLERFLSSKQAG
ncbi:MAG: PAS domain S-box protein [Solirubrobacteraceae bacterium]